MLKKLTTAAITTAGLLSLATPAFAATTGSLCPKTGTNFNVLCGLNLSGSVFGNLITIVFIISTLLALVYLIWGGIKWVLSGGDKTKVDAARAAIVASIVGLILIFLSYFILNVVVGIFVPGFSIQNVTLPTINDGASVNPCLKYLDETSCRNASCNWTVTQGASTFYICN